jgi:hypothetical protein
MSETAVVDGLSLDGLLPDELARLAWAPALPTIASPSWVGGDSVFFAAASPGGARLVARRFRPAALVRVDQPAMFAAMEVAAAAGIAPPLVFHDAGAGICVQEVLDGEWRLGTLYRLHLEPRLLRASLDARRRFAELAVDLPVVSVFDQIDSLCGHVRDRALAVPSPVASLVDLLAQIRGLLDAPAEPVPCHGDGAVSNLMFRGDEVRLVGWTQTARMDPLEELGSVLTEFVPFVADAAAVFEARLGEPDVARLARANLYGVADDVRWGLIGSIARAEDPDSPVEYQRYGHWRLFKARFAVAEGQVEQWMKEAS